MAQENSREAALVAANAANEKKATDIVVQDVSELLRVCDYFVICTAANGRRADAVADEVEEKLREKLDMKPLSREGREDCQWILLDYGTIVVHIFQPEPREFYRLEQLWDKAPIVDLAEAGIEDAVYSQRIGGLLKRNGQ